MAARWPAHFALVDVSALRDKSSTQTECLIESSVKLQGALSDQNRFALLDLACDGSLLDRQQHAGCSEKIVEISQRDLRGQIDSPQASLLCQVSTLYDLSQGYGLEILLAAKEKVGRSCGQGPAYGVPRVSL